MSEKYFIIISPPFKQGPKYLPMYGYSENGETRCGEDDSQIQLFDTYNEAEKVSTFLKEEFGYHTGVIKCPESLS